MNDTKKTATNNEEYYSLNPVTSEMKKSWMYAAGIYAGNSAVITVCMGGGGLISGLPLSQAILAMIIGLVIIIGLFYVPLGKIGAAEGLNTYMIGEAAFGKIGSNIITALVVTTIPCVGWYGINVSLATQSLSAVANLGETEYILVTLIFGVIFAIPAMYGILSMAWLNYVSVPIMFLVVIYGLIKTSAIINFKEIWAIVPATSMDLSWGINLQVGMLAVGATFVSDYTRWVKNRWSGIAAAGTVGYLPFSLLLGITGMLMSMGAVSLGVSDPWNIVNVMIKIGMPSIGLVLIFLLQWTTSVVAAYSAGLALNKVFGWSRFWWTLIAAIIGSILSITGIVNYFIGFLNILAAWVSPAAGVMISEYFFVSKQKFERKTGVYWPGVISWMIGGFICWRFTFFIPALNGFVIASIIYIVYHKLAYTKTKNLSIEPTLD